MTVPRSVADVLTGHVTLEVECIDRMYLNLYVPKLQYETGVVGFFKVLPATLSAHELAALGVHGSALLLEDGGARAVGATAVSPG